MSRRATTQPDTGTWKKQGANLGLFLRSERNPLITVQDLPYQANAVFNAARGART